VPGLNIYSLLITPIIVYPPWIWRGNFCPIYECLPSGRHRRHLSRRLFADWLVAGQSLPALCILGLVAIWLSLTPPGPLAWVGIALLGAALHAIGAVSIVIGSRTGTPPCRYGAGLMLGFSYGLGDYVLPSAVLYRRYLRCPNGPKQHLSGDGSVGVAIFFIPLGGRQTLSVQPRRPLRKRRSTHP